MTSHRLALLVALLASSVWALPPQSDHGSLQAVPAPGPVKIDGDLSDWDRSGEMFVYPARSLRARFSVRVHAMWDAHCLYLGLVWRDPTPLVNNVDADAAPNEGWMADAFQARFVTNKQVHLTAWYSSHSAKSVALMNYHSAVSEANKGLYRAAGLTVADASGFRQAFKADGDGRGYVQELAVPWKLLYDKPDVKAGLKMSFAGEYFWGGPSANKWPAVMWSDPINQKNRVRITVYQNPTAWGELELLPKGNLPRQSDEDEAPLLQGPLPIRFEVPADATRFSLVLDDARGRRVRNLAAHANVADYVVDGGRPRPNGGKLVEVPWDGRGEGKWDRDRMLFLGDLVAAGKYTARALVHAGVGVTYAGSFYSPGKPPWETADGSGGWGYDHSHPGAVGVMPLASKSKARVFLGWHGGECGNGLIGLDADGNKLWGWTRQSGADHIACAPRHVYFLHSGGKKLARVLPDNGQHVRFEKDQVDVELPVPATGLAVNDKTVAVALKARSVIWLLDADTGRKTGEIVAPGAGSMAFAEDGTLRWVAPDGVYFQPRGGSAGVKLALDEVGQPLALALDSAGMLYVSDAADQTVKVYRRTTLRGTIGEKGGHRPGPWNAQRMNNPVALAVEERPDSGFRVWVTEASFSPRRVSVWRADGKLLRDFIGNTRYAGSGGLLSDDVPDLGIVDGVVYRIDYPNHAYRPVEVMGGAPDPVPGKVSVFGLWKHRPGADFSNGNHFLSKASGKETAYYTESAGVCMVFLKRGERWLCVAALGHAAQNPFPAGFPKPPKANSVFAWNDLDGDGFQSPDEVQWFTPEGKPHVLYHKGWGYRCFADLTYYHSGYAFRPARFGADGAPVYDLTKVETLPGELGKMSGEIYRTRFGYVAHQKRDAKEGAVDPNGVIHGLHDLVGYDEKGDRRWFYPSYWVNVHGAMSAPMAMPGTIMGLLKISGVFDLGERSVIGVRGNIGQEFLLRDDGLYVGELFTDQRMAPGVLPDEKDLRKVIGLPLNDTTLHGEPFNGWIGRQRDGKVRMTYGYTDVRIAQLTGLDGVRTLPTQTVNLDEAALAKARTFVPKKGVAEEPKVYEVARGPAFGPDARQWQTAKPIVVRSGREEVARAWLRHDETALHAAWQVFDTTALTNKGQEAATAFKTGDSVNLFVADDKATGRGGVRVLVTRLGGKVTTVVYRQEGKGKAYTFSSPVRTVTFAHVAEEPGVKPGFRADANSYLVTASIPWGVLGVAPKPGQQLKGDVGVLFGDEAGATARRVHWADRETNVVNDVPTEAEFSPARWGTWSLR